MSRAESIEYPGSEEVALALRRCWQPVARIEDLAQGPQRAVLLGEALAVFLTEGGTARVVADRCPHRGASLAMGKVCGEALQCPYHGWEWNGDGTCARIPSLAEERQIPPSARTAAFAVREQWGLVWTVLEKPLGEPPTLPWFDAGQWRWGHGTPFELPVGIGVMIENFRDVAHFAFVHQATMGAMPEVVEPLAPERQGLAVTLHREMRAGEGAEEVWGSLREVRYHLIAPNLAAVQMFTASAGERCLLHVARAIGPTDSAHYWIEGFAEGFGECSLEEAIEAEERIYAEDIPIISAIEPRELSLDPSGELSTLADRYTLAYREAFAEFVRLAITDQASLRSS